MPTTQTIPPAAVPAEPLKPWASKPDPIVQFLTDDGFLYGAQAVHLSALSPDPQTLEVTAPPHKGVIVITGPAARELCACLCSGRATLVRADGLDITGVKRLSALRAEAQQQARELALEVEEADA